MKIAYLILCHTDPKHIARLVNKLTNGGGYAFVHVDKKTDDAPFIEELKDCNSVTFVKNRIKVFWGGFSSVEATLILMKTAVEYGEFDRFVLLQGLEYPIKSNAEIEEFFNENNTREFISAQNISIRKDARSIHKYRLYHFLDAPNSFIGKISRKINKKFLQMEWIPHLKSNTLKDSTGKKIDIYQGCAQIALTRAAVEYILEFNRTNKGFNDYFKTVFTVDEIYFHTIIYNSKFKENATGILTLDYPRLIDFRNLTYFDYEGDTVEIIMYKDKADYERIKESGYLYFRKVNSESKELLDYIDYYHLEGKK